VHTSGAFLWLPATIAVAATAPPYPPSPVIKGGFAIFDAPEPWGPWTTAFFTEEWDAGPGETSSLPTKWMSADGRTVHLVFSGDDCFSVRAARLTLAGVQ